MIFCDSKAFRSRPILSLTCAASSLHLPGIEQHLFFEPLKKTLLLALEEEDDVIHHLHVFFSADLSGAGSIASLHLVLDAGFHGLVEEVARRS